MKKFLWGILLFILFFQNPLIFAQKTTSKVTSTTTNKTASTTTNKTTGTTTGKTAGKTAPAEQTEEPAIEPNWQLVVGGAPVGNPIITEYGFAVPLEGRTMAAVSESGKLMWFAGLPGTRISPYSSPGTGDFLITISGGNSVSLINPSGLTLWSSKAPAEVISTPIQGRDGRIYVQCPREVACFGINGVLKWSTPAGESNGIPLMELEDGSILHIQKKTLQGCSTALRYSPFGIILEEITFSGRITSAIATKYGALLLFADGAVGCVSSTKNETYDHWVLPAGSINGTAAARIYLDDYQSVCAIVTPSGGQTTVTYLNPKDGTILLSATAPVDTNKIAFGTFDQNSLVLCDTSTAAAMSLDGTILWTSNLPGTINWTHIVYLPQGYLAMLEQGSWVISAYRVTQHIGTTSQTKQNNRSLSFPVYVQEAAQRENIPQDTSTLFGPAMTASYREEMRYELEEGNYNDKEAQWLAFVNLETSRLFSKYTVQTRNSPEPSFFDENFTYYEEIVNMMSSFQSGCFNKELARIIRTETDPVVLTIALKGAAKIAYDPTFELLESIEALLKKPSLIANSRISTLMCDAAYEICRFMGKPALFTKGRYILSYLLNQNIQSTTKIYATATMRKIIALEM